MDILIKGMEMPKTCGKCKMHFIGSGDYVCCSITERIPKIVAKFANSKIDLDFRKASIEAVKRPDWCPLIEVPPHGRLIDADALLEHMKKVHDKWKTSGHYTPTTDDEIMIMNMPTIIEADMREKKNVC